ncbi:MAG: hypothetical protein ACPGXK_10675 [Phycisphaerae bacterium]
MHIKSKHRLRIRVAMAAMCCVVSGCSEGLFSDGSPPRPTLNLTTLGVGEESTYFESLSNDLLENAEPVDITEESRVIRGSIAGNDVDVYDLGAVREGDRVLVEITASDTLDPALAIFDETRASLLINDHRNAYLGRKDPYVDVTLTRDSEHCYLAIAATPYYNDNGDYALLASLETNQPIPSPLPEGVLLVFNGANNVRIGSRPSINVPTFDAADIDNQYAGQTREMISRVTNLVRADFAEHDIEIFSTAEDASWDGVMTRIYFGTYDPGLLGVAEGVDELNRTPTQEAIIFTDTFAAFAPIEPSVEEMSQALANVTSHEIGHLLGLVHTRDSLGIMDVTASLNQLLADQSFRMSPIYEDVYPVGYQNAGQSLMDAVGGTFELSSFRTMPLPDDIDSFKQDWTSAARQQLILSSCGLHHH